MGGDPQIPLAEVDEDDDLSNRVGLEMSYLKPVEVKKPAEEGPLRAARSPSHRRT
jgi:hypothetical protein